MFRRGNQARLTGSITESHSYKMPEALKIDFMSSLIKMKKHVQKKRSIPLDFPEVPSPEKAIAIEKHDPSMVFPLSSVPSLPTSTRVVPFFDWDRETERYLERVLSGVVAKGPFAQISLDVEGIGRSLELGHGRTMEVEAATTKDASTFVVEK